MMIKQIILGLICPALLIFTSLGFAQTATETTQQDDSVFKKLSAVFTPYKPTYILPFFYNKNLPTMQTPHDEPLAHTEMKFQISINVALIPHLFNPNLSFNLAYTSLDFGNNMPKKVLLEKLITSQNYICGINLVIL